MSIPALVLIDRIKTLAQSYRARADQAREQWNELRRNGRPRMEKLIAAHDVDQFSNIADSLERIIQP